MDTPFKSTFNDLPFIWKLNEHQFDNSKIYGFIPGTEENPHTIYHVTQDVYNILVEKDKQDPCFLDNKWLFVVNQEETTRENGILYLNQLVAICENEAYGWDYSLDMTENEMGEEAVEIQTFPDKTKYVIEDTVEFWLFKKCEMKTVMNYDEL